MMTSATMTIRLDTQLIDQLDHLAESMHRSKSFLAAEAIAEYVKLQEWQLNEIKKGIEELDAGQVVSHADVKKHWEKKLWKLSGQKKRKKI